jgi:hypothetical protein
MKVFRSVSRAGGGFPDIMFMPGVGMIVDGAGGCFDLFYFMAAKRLVYVKHDDRTFVAAPERVL